jgi:hypothetical protein
MSPLARAWLRRIALGLPLVSAPAGAVVLLSTAACSCPDHTQTFAIDSSQAAIILDADGRATVQGCRTVCDALVNPPDTGPAATMSDAGSAAPRSEFSPAIGCHVISESSALEVRCEFHTACLGGRRPSGLDERGTGLVASAGAWLARMAWMEAASVDAFLDLAGDLRVHGAPDSFARRATRAAGDERRHAAMMTRVARARGAEPRTPRRERHRRPTLEALAHDNAAEGGVRETYGALLAAIQSELAPDADLREVMGAIARDEARHAMLSADIDAWARTRVEGPALEQARAEAADALARSIGVEHREDVAATLGLPSLEIQRALVRGLV